MGRQGEGGATTPILAPLASSARQPRTKRRKAASSAAAAEPPAAAAPAAARNDAPAAAADSAALAPSLLPLPAPVPPAPTPAGAAIAEQHQPQEQLPPPQQQQPLAGLPVLRPQQVCLLPQQPGELLQQLLLQHPEHLLRPLLAAQAEQAATPAAVAGPRHVAPWEEGAPELPARSPAVSIGPGTMQLLERQQAQYQQRVREAKQQEQRQRHRLRQQQEEAQLQKQQQRQRQQSVPPPAASEQAPPPPPKQCAAAGLAPQPSNQAAAPAAPAYGASTLATPIQATPVQALRTGLTAFPGTASRATPAPVSGWVPLQQLGSTVALHSRASTSTTGGDCSLPQLRLRFSPPHPISSCSFSTPSTCSVASAAPASLLPAVARSKRPASPSRQPWAQPAGAGATTPFKLQGDVLQVLVGAEGTPIKQLGFTEASLAATLLSPSAAQLLASPTTQTASELAVSLFGSPGAMHLWWGGEPAN